MAKNDFGFDPACGLCKAVGSGPSIYQAGAVARRRMGAGQRAVQRRQADADLRPFHAQWLRDGLETASSSLSEPDSRYGREIRALLAEPEDAAPEELRTHSEVLKQIEDSLESA